MYKPIKYIKAHVIHTGTIFFFHGLGDNGPVLYNIAKKMNFNIPHIKMIFPTAPVIPFTLQEGKETTAWFDRLDAGPEALEDSKSISCICEGMTKFIKEESEKTNIPMSRIVVGGFSLGGALAMHLGYHYLPDVAGIFGLSSYLNVETPIYEQIVKHGNPSLMFMCNGDKDEAAPEKWAQMTHKRLKDVGVCVEYHTIENAKHEITQIELDILKDWLANRILTEIFMKNCEDCW